MHHARRPMSVSALAVLATLTLASCGLSSSPSQEEGAAAESAAPQQEVNEELAASLPAEIKEAGVIRLATDPNYPPFETVADDGKTIVGLDPDIAHAVADILGVEIEFVETSFDGIIPAIEAGKVDMAMSSIGDTKEREKTVDFATYYWNGTLVLVKKGNPEGIAADQACGVSIGVIRGSLQQNTFLPAQTPKCEEAGLEPPTSQAYQNGPQAQLALKSGRIDGVMLDAPPLLDAAKKSPDEFETVGPLVRNPNPGGVAFPKGSELVEPVNEAINLLIEDGTYAEILEKWTLTDIAIEKSEINGAIE
ncbi:ABC transporter substrate-binding protein [Ornithinimicrobium murale]|uniref:ABC transporter substrate-binding protein n=1 Tax=Ornithinimicrobium murale TaxID=1050153 RepID=UPI0013B3D1BE|nr:ABC transporter substrate-binding protein [Ornithinimicrobium murale]